MKPQLLGWLLFATCLCPSLQQEGTLASDAQQSELRNHAGRRESGLHYMSRENYAQVAAVIASDKLEVVLTTISFHHDSRDGTTDQLDMMKNFAFFLHQSGRLRNTLIFSYDQTACRALLDVGILCFMDEAAPRPSELQGQYGEGQHPHWFAKYWHAHHLNELGYTVLFLDDDVVVLQDPFKFHDRQYDIEGLSDWNVHPHVPTQEAFAFHTCGVYRMYRDENVTGGQYLAFRWAATNENRTMEHVNPCQSTGVWFSEPTSAALAFLQQYLEWLGALRNDQWDQAAWNELIMAHLIGTGDRPGLRYRLLPIEHFNNIPPYEMRLKEGLPLDEVLMHGGEVHGHDKIDTFKRLNLWAADRWSPDAGLQLIHQFVLRLRGAPSEAPGASPQCAPEASPMAPSPSKSLTHGHHHALSRQRHQ